MVSWAAAATTLVLLALAGVIVGIVYQSVGLARDARRFPPPGQLVDLAGCRLHAICSGTGTPPVVLEAAIAASSLSWTRVQRLVERFTRVCSYDRRGLAWSDPPDRPPTFSRIVDDLDALTTTLEYREPSVFVGHSFGVLVCLTYAVRYPQRVAGLVLVDPPSEWMEIDPRRSRMVRGGALLAGLGALLARIGVVRACLALLTGGAPAAPRYFVKAFGPTTARTVERLVGEIRKLPPELHPVVQAMWCRPKCFRALADHLRLLREATAATRAVGSLGDVPVIVISSGDHPPDMRAAHQVLARMSSNGRVVVASKSGHWVPFDEPELVVDAIHEIVRGGNRS